ncbi:MAG TPA: hypothetical protein VHC49_10985 [Mycobacteriales bacterium]|nr:hypothetical protein [Mycobacteriales bacterium]
MTLLPAAFRHVIKTLPDIAYADQCGDRARVKMLYGGNADAPILSCVLRRGHDGRHVSGIRPRRHRLARGSRWTCYSWGRHD